MTRVEVKNREFNIEFDGSMQGFRMNTTQWKDSNWQDIEGFTWNIQRIGETQFEALCNLSSELFGEAVYGEDFAIALGVDIRFSDDVDCRDCDYFGNYEEMQEQDGEYLCLDCMEDN